MLQMRSPDFAVHRLVLGPLNTNCYIVDTAKGGIIIDPVADAEYIIRYCHEIDVAPKFAMLTHAHFDHIGAAAGLIESGFVDELWHHESDEIEFKRAKTYAMLIAKRTLDLPPTSARKPYDAGFIDMLNGFGLAIHHLPGHTPGCCIIHDLDRKYLFTGDIILNNRVPGVRTAVGEDRDLMRAAIQYIQKEFTPRTLIFPGHGDITLLETEFAYNKVIRDLLDKAV